VLSVVALGIGHPHLAEAARSCTSRRNRD
jgi:hypothetical protein